MKKIVLIFALGALFFLSGCGPTVVTQIKSVYIAPPKALIKECDVAEPMDPDVYVTSSWGLKEDMQSKLNRENIKNLSVCNKRLARVQEWVERHKALYDEDSPPSSAGAGGASGS